jgi:hypothetical protein
MKSAGFSRLKSITAFNMDFGLLLCSCASIDGSIRRLNKNRQINNLRAPNVHVVAAILDHPSRTPLLFGMAALESVVAGMVGTEEMSPDSVAPRRLPALGQPANPIHPRVS